MLIMSKNVTYIYIVQWVIIGFLSPLLVIITDIWVNIAIALAVLIISYFGGKLLNMKKLQGRLLLQFLLLMRKTRCAKVGLGSRLGDCRKRCRKLFVSCSPRGSGDV